MATCPVCGRRHNSWSDDGKRHARVAERLRLREPVYQTVREIQAEIAADSLDAAWAEAEAALPEGATLSVTKTHESVTSGRFVATTDHGDPRDGYAYADTPAAALRALAERLREARG